MDLPIVQHFSVNAALAVVAVYVFQLTFYGSLLVLNKRRAESHKLDMLPCVVSKASAAGESTACWWVVLMLDGWN